MNARYHRIALGELVDAMNYYDRKRPKLGDELYDDVEIGIQKILERPHSWPKVHEEVHSFRLDRFPYHLIYQVLPDRLLILAVSHTKRDPGYWMDRLSPDRP